MALLVLTLSMGPWLEIGAFIVHIVIFWFFLLMQGIFHTFLLNDGHISRGVALELVISQTQCIHL